MVMANVPAEVSLIGAILSRRYVLKHEIGRGGMGAVYAAERLDGGGPVAIKILHPYFLGDDGVMTRFLEEGRTCMRLLHTNILRVHECLAAEDGSPYLVMDLLEGVPLSAYTKDGGRVALGHAIPILQGMLAGLEAAHAFGVVHRDLKPGNVFLARTGEVFSVKLLDFGIAKVMDAAGGMGSKTSTGALLGTPAYMSPEQVKNAKDVDGRSDLWSVGVMFYEMLSGRVAFPAPTEYARLAAVIASRPAPIQSIDPDLAVVGPFLERALEKDRDRRFQSAREMGVALAALTPALVTGSAFDLSEAPPVIPGDHESSRTLVSSASVATGEPSAWSIVTDKTDPPSRADEASPAARPPAASDRKNVLSAPVMSNEHGSTLASPNRTSVAGAAPPAHAEPLPVVIVEESKADGSRSRETTRPPGPGVSDELLRPAERGWFSRAPGTLLAVAVAFALGIVVGFMAGRGHHLHFHR